MPSFAEVRDTLLNGKTLSWGAFGGHKRGTVKLSEPSQRRLLAYLLKQNPSKVADGNEELFPGLIAAWNDKESDPALFATAQQQITESGAWRLLRVEASGFGGLTLFGAGEFDLWIDGKNWCLEGQNGSGKTSLASSIMWALTGKRIREQDGPIDEQGARSPVTNSEGTKIGDWPSFVSYPEKAQDLRGVAETWVRLTFSNEAGELATAYRKMTCPVIGESATEEKIDPRLVEARELIEIGVVMPARIARVGFGEKSQSLYEAVKMLTGLDQLSDIADGCSRFVNRASRFLKYGKDNGIDGLRTRFEENMAKAQVKAKEWGFVIPENRALEDEDIAQALKQSATSASAEAGTHLATLKSEIAPKIGTGTAEGRLRVRNAVGEARAIVSQATKSLALFEAWTALKEAQDHEPFKKLPALIESSGLKLEGALAWHRRQTSDKKFRLKALAAQSFVPPHEHTQQADCPLCSSALLSEEQKSLAAELAELQASALEAERRIEDVCRELEHELLRQLPTGLAKHREYLSAMDPRQGYFDTLTEKLLAAPPFSDVLVGLAGRMKNVVLGQRDQLPPFSYPPLDQTGDEPAAVIKLRRTIHELRRLVSLSNWWGANRGEFRDAWSAIIGQKQPDGVSAPDTFEGELYVIDQALAKAEPLDELSGFLAIAADSAEKWAAIQKEQELREAISTALTPLKDLKSLVGAETAQSIATVSGRVRGILSRIHLNERLVYTEASLGKKSVNVTGGFDPEMQIDAALVANSSWLRAILWAFVLALREETIEAIGSNPFPLMVLDDPQATFDPRNKRKWAEEIVRLANLNAASKDGAQLILTTHERQFFQCVVDHERLEGEQALIGGVNKTCGVATIVNGSCLERAWKKAVEANDDALARDYIGDIRIYCEDLLKFMLRGEGQGIDLLSLDALKRKLRIFHDTHVAPFDRPSFTDLLKTLEGGGGKPMKHINNVHHADDESIGVAEASDAKVFWETKLRSQIHETFEVYDKFESFYGEPRSFPWAKNVIAFPLGRKDEVKALNLLQTGVAAAAKSDGLAGDGVVTVEEWQASTPITLPNHEVYQLSSSTLDPVAEIGDLLIVSNYAEVHARNLVIACFGQQLFARRYNLIDAHPGIVVLTGQSVDPTVTPEPVIVSKETAQIKKIVGTVFTRHALPMPPFEEGREVAPISEGAALSRLLDGARLLEVRGRSAEPIALNGQFLITRNIMKTASEIRTLDGRPIVAVDEDGTRYFKRLHCSSQIAILESLNPDGTTASELLTFDDSLGLPKITHALEVIGVLFELP